MLTITEFCMSITFLDHIISYLNHSKRLNCGPTSEKERVEREKKIQRKKAKDRMKHQMTANVSGTRFEIGEFE